MGDIDIGVPGATSYGDGFGLYNFRIIRPAVPARHARALGCSLVNLDTLPLTDVTLELLEYPDFDTVISTLDNAFDVSFTEQKNDTGAGNFSLALSDDDAALIEPGGNFFVRFRRFTLACMMMACETFARTARDPDNKDDQEIVEWSGPGHAVILDDAVVYPARGLGNQPREDDRPMDWTAPAFNPVGWYPPIVLQRWAVFRYLIFLAESGVILPGGEQAEGQRHIDDNTPVLARPFSSIYFALEGDDYFRQWVYISTSFYYTLRAWMDDYGEIFVDGQQIVELSDGSQSETLFYLTTGWHLFASHLHNYPGPFFTFTTNPEGLAWSLFLAGGLFEGTTPVAQSDTHALMVALAPTAPGMTVGEILIIMLQEAQLRGCFPDLTWTFTKYSDTDGNPWPVVNEISTKVGTSYLDFFNEIAQTWMDYRFRPSGLVMDAWVKDKMGKNKGVDWTSSDFLLGLTQEGGG